MEKRTLLAVGLSVMVITVFYTVQGIFFPPPPRSAVEAPAAISAPADPGRTQRPAGEPAPAPAADRPFTAEGGEDLVEQRVSIETNLVSITLSSFGGDIVSYKLKQHTDKDGFLEMVLSGNTEAHAFAVALGNTGAQPLTDAFHMRRLSDYAVEFYRDFTLEGEKGRFRLSKRYDFKPNEYMFEMTISLGTTPDSTAMPALDFGGAAYTLSFGPQIGPSFERLDQRNDYRNYYTFANGKQKQEKVNDIPATINTLPKWAAIAGKYFTFIAVPYPSQYDVAFSSRAEPGLNGASRFYIIRPAQTGRVEDTYRFYLGPKEQEALAVYNNGNNSFNLRDMEMIKIANTSGILSPLESGLKWLLMLFYRLIPNYGVAIILLTLLVKVLFFPLTKKSSESTLRMQALAPRVKEIQEKYKDTPQKMNAEMAEFYKKEGYNPLAGCLPMLLQIPIFIAMYNLFNNHFDLRGALFIPGWIPDLSIPESIFNFAPITIPILGWSDIRLLPIIYVGSQLLYGKITQTPDQQGNTQMKLMLYAMPIFFFFVLYNMPSGMLVYWIFSNILALVQQLAINKYLAPKRAAIRAENEKRAELKIAPKKKKKR
jgi:YidC/Oxa1 family membrane protein insertase